MRRFTREDFHLLGDMVDLARRRPDLFLKSLPPNRTELTELLEWEAREMGSTVHSTLVGRLTAVIGSPDWLDPTHDDPRLSRAAFPQGGVNGFRPSFVLPAFVSTIASVGRDGVTELAGALAPGESDALIDALASNERLLAFVL